MKKNTQKSIASPHAAGLRLRVAMEQRARRLEMENLLHSTNPTISNDDYEKRGSAHSPASSSSAAAHDLEARGLLSGGSNALGYIVDAVQNALDEYDRDPEAFKFFTLVVAPKEADQDDDDDDNDHKKKEEQQQKQQQKEQKSRSPEPSSREEEEELGSVLRGRQGVRQRGDAPITVINHNHRGRGARLISISPATISHEMLPVVADYINSRLAHLGLQNISLPTLAFSHEHSPTVTEILLTRWIITRSAASLVRLKNLYLPDSANFASRDYARIRECLNRNRMQCLVIDREHIALQEAVERASNVMEWCGGRKQQKRRDEREMLKSLEEREREERQFQMMSDDASSSKMREIEFDKRRRAAKMRRALDHRERGWIGCSDGVTQRQNPAENKKPPLPAAAFGRHEHNNSNKSPMGTSFGDASGDNNMTSPSAKRPASRRLSNRASRLRATASASSRRSSSPPKNNEEAEREESPPHETDDLGSPQQQRAHFDVGEDEEHSAAKSKTTAAAKSDSHPQQQKQNQKRDPSTISEVELQGPFGRVIAAESKRRYRLMTIEMDSVVPILVAMQLSHSAVEDRVASKHRKFQQ